MNVISLLEFNTRPSGVRIIKLPALRFVIKIRDKCSMGDFGGEKNSLRKILPVYKFFFFCFFICLSNGGFLSSQSKNKAEDQGYQK